MNNHPKPYFLVVLTASIKVDLILLTLTPSSLPLGANLWTSSTTTNVFKFPPSLNLVSACIVILLKNCCIAISCILSFQKISSGFSLEERSIITKILVTNNNNKKEAKKTLEHMFNNLPDEFNYIRYGEINDLFLNLN